MPDPIDVSLVIACYNEEPLLVDSVRKIIDVMDATRWSYELIFVDDCSRDRTREIIDELIAEYPDRALVKLFHEHNTGRGRTVTDGMHLARGRVAGYLDIDLEVGCHYVPLMVLGVQQGADVAVAYRIYKITPRLFHRFILSQGYVRLMRWALGIPLRDTESGFKFFNRERILPILDQTQDPGWFWDTEIMVRAYYAGLKIVEPQCLFVRRYDKQSSVNVIQDTRDYFVKLWRFRPVAAALRDQRT